ncbi:MAG: aspartate kinase, partial [Clostridia bacterium]|nr:aspartate kinase [Clostridia bacterium]
MGIKVVKFGGSSLCDAEHFKKVKKIIESDPSRCYVVPSAPGKRFDGDIKITDLLYQCYRLVDINQPYEEVFERIANRYLQIADELHLDFDLEKILRETSREIHARRSIDYAASRGEYLNGILLAEYLGWDFIDPVDVIKFDRRGAFASEWTNEMLRKAMEDHPRAVIPGFYGSYPNGEVHTFSRGGSDVSGAIVARAAEAEMYENWTDVNGFLMADPRVVDNPRCIRRLTYRELRELSYMGATVLHEEAIFPVHKAGIPTNIRNTNAPEEPGTLIESQPSEENMG